MWRFWAVFVSVLGVSEASAQEFPALYDLDPDAAIAVRTSPSSTAAIVTQWLGAHGSLEVIARTDSGAWLRIASAYGEGWVVAQGLRRRPPQKVPDQLSCTGVQSDWRIEQRDTSVFVDLFDGFLYRLERKNRFPDLVAGSEDGELRLTIRPGVCRSEVSDMQLGLRASGQFTGFSAPIPLLGCCSLRL